MGRFWTFGLLAIIRCCVELADGHITYDIAVWFATVIRLIMPQYSSGRADGRHGFPVTVAQYVTQEWTQRGRGLPLQISKNEYVKTTAFVGTMLSKVLHISLLTFWHRNFTFNWNKSPTWCKNFSVYYPDVCLQLNMFRAFSRPSSGAQWLQWQPLVLPSYRGDSRAVFVVGPTRTDWDYIRRIRRRETTGGNVMR